jgi:hypothetical protein
MEVDREEMGVEEVLTLSGCGYGKLKRWFWDGTRSGMGAVKFVSCLYLVIGLFVCSYTGTSRYHHTVVFHLFETRLWCMRLDGTGSGKAKQSSGG